jgi:hypothetical protein
MRAAVRYEARAGLGADLFDRFDRAIDEIVKAPRMWPRWTAAPTAVEIRRYILDRYPYYLPYLVGARGSVTVLAFAHAKQRADYWVGRVRRPRSRKTR